MAVCFSLHPGDGQHLRDVDTFCLHCREHVFAPLRICTKYSTETKLPLFHETFNDNFSTISRKPLTSALVSTSSCSTCMSRFSMSSVADCSLPDGDVP